MRPLRRSIIESSTARVTAIGPRRLIASTWSQVSGALSTNGSMRSQPAQLTSTSIGPSRSAASSTPCRTDSSSVTSSSMATA